MHEDATYFTVMLLTEMVTSSRVRMSRFVRDPIQPPPSRGSSPSLPEHEQRWSANAFNTLLSVFCNIWMSLHDMGSDTKHFDQAERSRSWLHTRSCGTCSSAMQSGIILRTLSGPRLFRSQQDDFNSLQSHLTNICISHKWISAFT